LESVAGQFKEDVEGGSWFRVPSDYVAELSETQILATSQAAADAVGNQEKTAVKPTSTEAPSEVMQEVATVLADVPAILSAIREQKGVSERGRVVEPRTGSDSYH